MENVTIIADSREDSTRIPSILKKFCNVQTKQLVVGDYILSDRVCAERKSIKDFMQSLCDHRLFNQINAMKESFEKPLIIIEGENLMDNINGIHPNAIRGAIAAIAVDYGVPMIWTKTQMDTAHQLLSIAKREQIEEKRTLSIRAKKKFFSLREQQEFLVSGLPNISNEKAKNLLKHFKTPERIFSSSENELREVEGIGEKLAKKIRKILTEDYQ